MGYRVQVNGRTEAHIDRSLSDANALIMAKNGSGKTFMVQKLLSMASRANPLVLIIERSDSYRPLVELMGRRMIANVT